MVKLIVDDFEQVSILESMLEKANISYELEIGDKAFGIKPPFLMVDGVPLDFGRSSKWIKERSKK